MKAPLMLYSDIEPLTSLITDATISSNLQKAIVAYGTTGKIPS